MSTPAEAAGEAAAAAGGRTADAPGSESRRGGGEAVSETPLLALPPPRQQREGGTVLDLSTGPVSVKLDALGPVVVAEDGTISRIGNWAELTPAEQANTQRIISQRNNQRLAKLNAAQAVPEPLD